MAEDTGEEGRWWAGNRKSYYLLKPIENQQLIETVLQVGKAIRQEREKNVEYNRLKKELPSLQKQFIIDLLKGRLTEEEKISEKIRFLQIPLNTQALIIVVLRVDDVHLLIQTRSAKKLKLVMEKINRLFAQQVMEKAGYQGLLLDKEPDELVAVLQLPERTESQVPRLKGVLKKFTGLLSAQQEFDLTVSIGISAPFQGAASINEGYQEALTSANTKFVPGTNSITYIEDEGVQDCHSVVKAAVAYIKKNYSQNITVEMAARELLVSPSYLMHLIKEELGKTFVECLTDYRIEKAKELLKENKHRVYEVCSKVGYQNPKYFSQLFKRVTGFSPSDYAKLG